MATKLTAGAIRRQKERAEVRELMQVYGVLLTPRQQEYMDGFVAGKSFSAMGRDSGVSRQAVHEAVRAVQRQLRWYEEKLGLLRMRSGGSQTPPTAQDLAKRHQAADRLKLLAEFIREQGIIYSPDLVVRELQDIMAYLGVPRTARQRRATSSSRA
mgnify:CR=1 FL=1